MDLRAARRSLDEHRAAVALKHRQIKQLLAAGDADCFIQEMLRLWRERDEAIRAHESAAARYRIIWDRFLELEAEAKRVVGF